MYASRTCILYVRTPTDRYVHALYMHITGNPGVYQPGIHRPGVHRPGVRSQNHGVPPAYRPYMESTLVNPVKLKIFLLFFGSLAVFKYIGCNNILKSNKIIGFKLHHKRYFTVDSNNDNLIVLRHIEHRLRKSSQPCFAPGIQ